MSRVGALLFVLGAGAAMYYWQFFDTSVETQSITIMGQSYGGGMRVNNLGLMQDRQNGLIIGAVSAVIGLALVLYAKSQKEGPVRDATSAASPIVTMRDERDCPHCAEKILANAKVCKHCGRDVIAGSLA